MGYEYVRLPIWIYLHSLFPPTQYLWHVPARVENCFCEPQLAWVGVLDPEEKNKVNLGTVRLVVDGLSGLHVQDFCGFTWFVV